MSRGEFTEFTSAFLTLLMLCAAVMFIRYVVRVWGSGFWKIQGALAIATLLVGTALYFMVRWYIWAMWNEGVRSIQINVRVLLDVAAIIMVAGVLWVMRVFAPAEWKFWPVVLSLSVSGAGAYAMFRFV